MWIKVKPEDFEKEVCSRCPADINKDYSPCKKCKKQNDFETVYKVWKKTVRKKELEKQVEKMKCCQNCKHFDFNEPNYCHKGVYRERQYVCSEWEFGN